jgi:hypothetical protein
MKTVDFGNKPFGTKIQLTKGGDFFEIYIPPYEYSLWIFFMAPYISRSARPVVTGYSMQLAVLLRLKPRLNGWHMKLVNG